MMTQEQDVYFMGNELRVSTFNYNQVHSINLSSLLYVSYGIWCPQSNLTLYAHINHSRL